MAAQQDRRAGRRSGRRCIILVAAAALFCAGVAPAFAGFSSGAATRSRVVLNAAAAPAPAPAPKESVALVKITEESSKTTASILGGALGLLLGGVWLGGTLFTISSYLARKEDSDVSKALKGIAAGSLEALNFTAYLNDKYAVTTKVSDAFAEAIKNQDTETSNSVSSFFDGVKQAVDSLDKDIGLKKTFGDLATSASDLAFQALDKAVELNDKYKISDQIKEKIDEASKKA